ncbi:hypothetical protein [Fulvimarina sp. MAC3]|uniref:hypothetical protein n=1 Tax=Fulvimarina sp. MAC3 TaxID=3148887 RepID=UPI0031FC1A05
MTSVTGKRRFDRKTATLLVAALTPAMLNACSTMDMISGIDGNLVPPASIGSGGGVYGSPSVTSASSGNQGSGGYGGPSAPTPPYPVEKLGEVSQSSGVDYSQPVQQSPASQQSAGIQQNNSLMQNASFQRNDTYQQAAPAGNTIQSAPLLAPPTSQQPIQQPAETVAQPVAEPAYSSEQETFTEVQEASLAPPPSQPAPAPQPQSQIAAVGQTSSEVQFLPLVGAPNEQANILAQALADEANRSGVTIRPASEKQASVRLKGYFSAFDEGDQSVLVYVWDVLDQNDERIHRIQGQERFARSPDGSWAGVDRAVLDRVARTTLQEAQSLPQASG